MYTIDDNISPDVDLECYHHDPVWRTENYERYDNYFQAHYDRYARLGRSQHRQDEHVHGLGYDFHLPFGGSRRQMKK